MHKRKEKKGEQKKKRKEEKIGDQIAKYKTKKTSPQAKIFPLRPFRECK